MLIGATYKSRSVSGQTQNKEKRGIEKTTKEVIAKIALKYPQVYMHLLDLRNDYVHFKNVSRYAYEYTLALRDSGIITERERQILFIFTTIEGLA